MSIEYPTLDDLVGELRREVDEAAASLRRFIDQRAGLAKDRTGDDGRRRSKHPQFKTSYTNDRTRALTKVLLDSNQRLAGLLPEVVKHAIRVKFSTIELAAIEALVADEERAQELRREQGFYPEARSAVDRLFEQHHVTRWHFANVTDEQLARIASILWRKDEGGAA